MGPNTVRANRELGPTKRTTAEDGFPSKPAFSLDLVAFWLAARRGAIARYYCR
jgi:hypothetical protein